MANNLVWSLVAVVLAALTAFLPLWRSDPSPPGPARRIMGAGPFIAVAVLLLFTGATLMYPAAFPYGSWVALALALGVLAAALSTTSDHERGAFAVGLATVGASSLHFFPAAGISAAQLAFVSGTFLGAFACGGLEAIWNGGYLCSLAALMITAADFLGRLAVGSEPASASGVLLGIAFLAAAVIAGVLQRIGASRFSLSGLGVTALALAGFLGCWKYVGSSELAELWFGGVVVAVIVHFVFVGGEADSFRFIVATVIWLAAATVAFGIALGHGMAVALLAGTLTLVMLGSVRGLMSLSVASVVLVYRLFRELYPDDARAPDIGQHYTMIGIAIGALLPLLPIEWARGRDLRAARGIVATIVWLLILLALPVAASVMLGAKGAVGMVVGFGFAGVIEATRGTVSLAPAGLAAGLACVTASTYGWLGEWADLERAAKVRAVVYVAAAAMVLSLLLLSVSRREPEVGANEA